MRKLPVVPAFLHALKSTWHNLPFAFHASWPWLLVLVPIALWAESGIPDIDPATATPEQMLELQKAALTFYASTFVSIIVYASIGVSWHRYILLDEVPQGAARMRLDRTVWRYVGNTVLVALMVLALLLPLALFFAAVATVMGGMQPAIMALYLAFTLLVALPATYRLSLKLPAIAVGKQDFRFRDAWSATAGNMSQLMLLGALGFAVVLLAGVVLGGVETLFTRALGETAKWVFMVLRQAMSWIVAIFTITMLTSLYGFFVEKRDF